MSRIHPHTYFRTGGNALDEKASWPSRKRVVPKKERHSLDEATYARLANAGLSMKRREEVVLIDQNVDVGREFELSTLPRHPVFSTTAAQRAAEMALSFDAFVADYPQPDARPVTLRPAGGPVAPCDLEVTLKAFSAAYDDAIKGLAARRLVAPLHSTVHIGWKAEDQRFDIHLHCVWNCLEAEVETIRAFLAERFGAVWISGERAKNVGAVVNYGLMGSIRHAEFDDWSNEAIVALASLRKIRLHRPAGLFALYRKSLKGDGLRLRRTPYGIQQVSIERRPRSRPNDGAVSGSFRGMRRLKIAGKVRICAIHVRVQQAVEPQRLPVNRGCGTFEHTTLPVSPQFDRPSNGAKKEVKLGELGVPTAWLGEVVIPVTEHGSSRWGPGVLRAKVALIIRAFNRPKPSLRTTPITGRPSFLHSTARRIRSAFRAIENISKGSLWKKDGSG